MTAGREGNVRKGRQKELRINKLEEGREDSLAGDAGNEFLRTESQGQRLSKK